MDIAFENDALLECVADAAAFQDRSGHPLLPSVVQAIAREHVNPMMIDHFLKEARKMGYLAKAGEATARERVTDTARELLKRKDIVPHLSVTRMKEILKTVGLWGSGIDGSIIKDDDAEQPALRKAAPAPAQLLPGESCKCDLSGHVQLARHAEIENIIATYVGHRVPLSNKLSRYAIEEPQADFKRTRLNGYLQQEAGHWALSQAGWDHLEKLRIDRQALDFEKNVILVYAFLDELIDLTPELFKALVLNEEMFEDRLKRSRLRVEVSNGQGYFVNKWRHAMRRPQRPRLFAPDPPAPQKVVVRPKPALPAPKPAAQLPAVRTPSPAPVPKAVVVTLVPPPVPPAPPVPPPRFIPDDAFSHGFYRDSDEAAFAYGDACEGYGSDAAEPVATPAPSEPVAVTLPTGEPTADELKRAFLERQWNYLGFHTATKEDLDRIPEETWRNLTKVCAKAIIADRARIARLDVITPEMRALEERLAVLRAEARTLEHPPSPLGSPDEGVLSKAIERLIPVIDASRGLMDFVKKSR